MTDKEKFIKLLNEFGIPFKENLFEKNDVCFGYDWLGRDWEGSDKVGGYNGFFSSWEFDDNGKFVVTGVWE